MINNTIVQASDGRWAINISDGSTGNTLRNNIPWSDHSFRGVISIDAASLGGFSSDRNSVMSCFSTDGGDTVMSLAAWQALATTRTRSVATPAQNFVTPGKATSTCCRRARSMRARRRNAPATDLDGEPRPAGASVDLGAYELQLTSCGNGTVDPGEECEQAADCGGGATCVACACHGAGMHRQHHGDEAGAGAAHRPTSVTFIGRGGDPLKPWTGIDPPANGVRRDRRSRPAPPHSGRDDPRRCRVDRERRRHALGLPRSERVPSSPASGA